MRMHVVTAAASLTVLLGGCALGSEGSATPSSTDPVSVSPTPTTSVPASPLPGDGATPTAAPPTPADLRSEPRVVAAISDLTTRESVRAGDVLIAAWTPVTWADSSLGCPEPDMSYTQAEVPGELLILRIDAGLYQYHAEGGGAFRYCADPAATYTVRG